jgi:hypothetical protein
MRASDEKGMFVRTELHIDNVVVEIGARMDIQGGEGVHKILLWPPDEMELWPDQVVSEKDGPVGLSPGRKK